MITLPFRVYYEDTDAAGVVYYANYLRFCERARTEWLRQAGFEQQQLKETFDIIFAVRAVTADYLSPAYLDDELHVTAKLDKLQRASFTFTQTVTRDALCLFTAQIVIVCVDWQKKKATALPDTIRKQFLSCTSI